MTELEDSEQNAIYIHTCRGLFVVGTAGSVLGRERCGVQGVLRYGELPLDVLQLN